MRQDSLKSYLLLITLMKIFFGWLIWLCIVIILFITRCDKVCLSTREITKNLKEAHEQQLIYSWHIGKAGEYLYLADQEIKLAAQAKVSQWKHEKTASSIYWSWVAFGNYVYAGWDEWLAWLVETWHSDRDLILMDRICKHWKINWSISPLCDNWDMYYTGKKIFEDRWVPYWIALGIMFAESHIWINYAWSCDSSWNNRGGIKWRKNDDGSTTKDQQIPNNWNCYLYKFDSIEDYFKSKANTLWLWYKSCFSQDKPITCISRKYVWSPNVAESSWIKHVSMIAE